MHRYQYCRPALRLGFVVRSMLHEFGRLSIDNVLKDFDDLWRQNLRFRIERDVESVRSHLLACAHLASSSVGTRTAFRISASQSLKQNCGNQALPSSARRVAARTLALEIP